MSYVLIMVAFEFGNPMMLFILVETYDAPIHGGSQTRGLTSVRPNPKCPILRVIKSASSKVDRPLQPLLGRPHRRT
jgi:hypothetical protein